MHREPKVQVIEKLGRNHQGLRIPPRKEKKSQTDSGKELGKGLFSQFGKPYVCQGEPDYTLIEKAHKARHKGIQRDRRHKDDLSLFDLIEKDNDSECQQSKRIHRQAEKFPMKYVLASDMRCKLAKGGVPFKMIIEQQAKNAPLLKESLFSPKPMEVNYIKEKPVVKKKIVTSLEELSSEEEETDQSRKKQKKGWKIASWRANFEAKKKAHQKNIKNINRETLKTIAANQLDRWEVCQSEELRSNLGEFLQNEGKKKKALNMD